MANVLKMPRLSDTMVEGVLVSWHKKEGDSVEPGDVVAEVETDKATMELETFDGGVLRKLLLKEGESIPVGGAVAIIAEDMDEDISDALRSIGQEVAPEAAKAAPVAAAGKQVQAPSPAAVPRPAAPPAAVPQPAAPPAAVEAPKAAAAPSEEGGRVKASPLARRIAAENQLDLGVIPGSGPGGRVIRRDVQRAIEAVPAPVMEAPAVAAPLALGVGERVPLSQMRKTIARRMTEAKQSVPHFYLTAEVDMGPAMALREQLNQAAAGSVKISINDLILKACATALEAHPRVNASYDGDQLILHSAMHIGFAAAMEEGLITPTIRDCQTKSIGQIAKESRSLAERAVARKLKPEEFTGATFTVSNLGMYGIVEFVAIINPPQAAILAVGAVRDIPVVVDGQLTVGKRMRVTLSCDHRVIDGAQGAQFLSTLREILEKPMRLLL